VSSISVAPPPPPTPAQSAGPSAQTSAPATTGGAAVLLAPPERSFFGLPLSAWIQIGAVASCMAVLFWPNLRRLILKTNSFTGEANCLN
jgi:hypothetical protein